MKAHELLYKLKALNVKIWAEGEKLRWSAPKGVVTDKITAQMKVKKSELISILRSNRPNEQLEIKEKDKTVPTTKSQQKKIDFVQIQNTIKSFSDSYSGPPGKIVRVEVPVEGDLIIDIFPENGDPHFFTSYKAPLVKKSNDYDEGQASKLTNARTKHQSRLLLPKRYRDVSSHFTNENHEEETPLKIVKRGRGDFPSIYRPCRISEVYGQEEVKNAIANGLNGETLSQVLLFYGVSGTGKTTLGRIIAMGLNCEKGPTSEPCCECEFCKAVLSGNSFAFQEFDAGHLSGVERMRKERQNFAAAPLGYEKNKIIVFDECHRLSEEAQSVLLKPTEDVLSQLYFIFCTTDYGKTLETLRNRCMQFEFRGLATDEIRRLLCDVCMFENLEADSGLLENIIPEAKGMPRNALFLLQKAVASGKLKSLADGRSGLPKQEKQKTTEVYDVEPLF
jgi:DNA polymerase III delta prime subunit